MSEITMPKNFEHTQIKRGGPDMGLGLIGTQLRHMQALDRYVPAEEYDVEYYERWYPTDGFLKRELDRRTRNAMDLAGIRNGMKLIVLRAKNKT